MGCDHPSSHVALAGNPPEGIRPVQQSGGARGGHVVHGARAGAGGPHRSSVGQDPDPSAHAGRPVLTTITIRGDSADSSRGRWCRPDGSRGPEHGPEEEGYALESLADLRSFYLEAAAERRHVVFTVYG